MIIRFRSASVITESSNHPHPNNDDLVLSGFLADAAGRKWVSARFSTTAFGDGPADFLKVSGAVCFHRFHSFSIYSLRCGSVCVCVRQEMLEGIGVAALVWMVSHRFLTPCSCQYMSTTCRLVFFSHTTLLFGYHSDDLPQLSVFQAFFTSMPCCCRLDLGSPHSTTTWEVTEETV